MNAQQIQWVQSSFQTLAADPDGVARAFYAQLFRIAPELRPMFKPEMGEQRARLMQVLAAAVRGLDDLDRLLPTLHALGRRHAGYGVEPRHYAVVGRALVEMGGMPVWREGVTTDNGHWIIDVTGLDYSDPDRLEARIDAIAGVVSNGLFCRRRADLVVTDGVLRTPLAGA